MADTIEPPDLTAPVGTVQAPTVDFTAPTLGLFVRGRPVGQPRVRARRVGSFVRMYDPGTANDWRAALAAQVGAAMAAANLTPYKVSSPLWIQVDFIMPRPKSHICKSGLRSTAPRFHVFKPDVDNLAKTLDGLHGVLFDDDRSVVCLLASKRWAEGGQHPGAHLLVGLVKGPPASAS